METQELECLKLLRKSSLQQDWEPLAPAVRKTSCLALRGLFLERQANLGSLLYRGRCQIMGYRIHASSSSDYN